MVAAPEKRNNKIDTPNDSAIGEPAQRFAVLCRKFSGLRYRFDAYDSWGEADAVSSCLRAVGCEAVVEVAQ